VSQGSALASALTVTLLNISQEGMGSSEHPHQGPKSLCLGGCKVSVLLEDNHGFVTAIQSVQDMGLVVHGTEQEVPLENDVAPEILPTAGQKHSLVFSLIQPLSYAKQTPLKKKPNKTKHSRKRATYYFSDGKSSCQGN